MDILNLEKSIEKAHELEITDFLNTDVEILKRFKESYLKALKLYINFLNGNETDDNEVLETTKKLNSLSLIVEKSKLNETKDAIDNLMEFKNNENFNDLSDEEKDDFIIKLNDLQSSYEKLISGSIEEKEFDEKMEIISNLKNKFEIIKNPKQKEVSDFIKLCNEFEKEMAFNDADQNKKSEYYSAKKNIENIYENLNKTNQFDEEFYNYKKKIEDIINFLREKRTFMENRILGVMNDIESAKENGKFDDASEEETKTLINAIENATSLQGKDVSSKKIEEALESLSNAILNLGKSKEEERKKELEPLDEITLNRLSLAIEKSKKIIETNAYEDASPHKKIDFESSVEKLYFFDKAIKSGLKDEILKKDVSKAIDNLQKSTFELDGEDGKILDIYEDEKQKSLNIGNGRNLELDLEKGVTKQEIDDIIKEKKQKKVDDKTQNIKSYKILREELVDEIRFAIDARDSDVYKDSSQKLKLEHEQVILNAKKILEDTNSDKKDYKKAINKIKISIRNIRNIDDKDLYDEIKNAIYVKKSNLFDSATEGAKEFFDRAFERANLRKEDINLKYDEALSLKEDLKEAIKNLYI
ncbi:MAG: hypothetical protein SOZ89_02765 [Peptoniphilaceae bacterium]|nr:hypothetical protein [Peptoniphilaceae bacterium]MDD7383885.1 hypothetical protein [Peptoniphilaceae bacterium]MDY3738026.1 hypothetical protein [Peptoniphilaceae bacterium]